MKNRLWARGITTTYGYNSAGDLQTVSYSDSTAGYTNGFDRRGRKISIIHGPTTTTLTYNDPGQILTESYSGGPLDGLSVTNGYDVFLRRTNLVLKSQISNLQSNSFGYDQASRLRIVADATNSAGYAYLANSPLISQILFTNNGAPNDAKQSMG